MCDMENYFPSTSDYCHDKASTMCGQKVRWKRLQTFKRQFSISFDDDKEFDEWIESEMRLRRDKGNKDDHLFKNPGNLRAIKRKRTIVKKSTNESQSRTAKRRKIVHQVSVYDEKQHKRFENAEEDEKEEEQMEQCDDRKAENLKQEKGK